MRVAAQTIAAAHARREGLLDQVLVVVGTLLMKNRDTWSKQRWNDALPRPDLPPATR